MDSLVILAKIGFRKYIDAVQLKNISREGKLIAIVDTFHEEAKLLASTGESYVGKESIKAFYSDVLEKSNDTFNPQLNEKSVCFSENGVVAAEVHLVQINKWVADFWYFDEKGLITQLTIYSRTNQL